MPSSRPVAFLAAIALAAFAFPWVGAVSAAAETLTFSNTTPIAVPAAGSPDQIGPGSPYPSPITVSGMTGTVTDVNVTLTSVAHGIAQDMDVLLVGPTGQNLVLMSDAAGGGGFGANGTLTFDDAATGAIPSTGVVGTGTYRPTDSDVDGADTFPAPSPAPSSATTLSVFNGTVPNGTWSLYAVDDATGDIGSISGGWSITVTTGEVTQPGVLQFTSGSFRGAEGGGPVAVTLQRVAGDDGAVSVTLSTTTPATATPGIDFTPLNQTVSFADGQTTASVPLTILNDTAVEGIDETVTVALTNPGGGATLGTPSTAVVTIDDNDATFDTTPITIPGIGTGGTAGVPATPYPSRIHVTGAPALIGGVEVTVTGFGHQVPFDVDMLLVGPQGQNAVLMSDVGGQNAASGLNLTFADAAAGPIPAAGPLTSGRFNVSDDDAGGADPFPGPAPPPSSATSLAAFDGTNPNGVWSLYVVDDASGDVGSISGGWSLTFLPSVVADAGGPYLISEGQPLTLDASGTVAPVGATYAWDLDGDTQFDDATGASPTVSAAALVGLGLGDGPAGPRTIALQVTATPTVKTDTSTVTVGNAAPTASVATVPSGVVAGTAASVTFGASDPSAADAAAGFTYTIDWGDASAVQSVSGGASVTVEHTYAAAGTFTISVTATDKDAGVSAPATAPITVAGLVVPDAGGPYAVAEGATLTLDGTGSVAGPSATYAWDLDNDGAFDDATGPTPSLDPAALGALGFGDGPDGPSPVALQVTEGTQSPTASTTLTVTNTPPSVRIDSVPPVAIAGSAASVTFGASDPSAADTAAGFTYAIDWGDGSAIQSVSGGASVAVEHTYAVAGTFTISVTATDKDAGVSAPATAPITVVAEVLADAGGPYTVAEGATLTLDGTGSVAGPSATYAWDLDNDGSFDDATGPTPSIDPAGLAALGLTDGPDGPVSIGLQVTEGTQSPTDSTTISMSNTPPTASVGAVPSGVIAGSPATVTFGATDPSAADTAAGYTYAIDWGDGSTSTASGGASVQVEHEYSAAGTFTISVTAADKDAGVSAPATAPITVAALVEADAGGPYAIAEGDTLDLDATGSTAGPSATYAWDLDDDGQFDDATGSSPALSPEDLAAVGLADGPTGPVPISVQVTEGTSVDTATTTYEISNVAPVAVVQFSGPVVAGVPKTIKVGAEDPSPTDAAGLFEYRIDWEGDGVVDDVLTGPADPPATHTYPTAGNVGLSVVAVDKDGAASTPTAVTVTVSPASPGGGNGDDEDAPSPDESDDGLADTGSNGTTTVLIATALLLAGLLLIALARRRVPVRQVLRLRPPDAVHPSRVGRQGIRDVTDDGE
jgi:subtilisin-like proprotein convertase family protein